MSLDFVTSLGPVVFTHKFININVSLSYMYMCISATALCAFGVTGFSMLLSDFCYPVLSAFLLIGPPPHLDGHKPEMDGRIPPNPVGRP